MREIVTAVEMKELDHNTIQKAGISSPVLMERAALKTVEEIVQRLKNKEKEKILVVCGTGNNGGDGLAIARLLQLRGVRTWYYIAGKEEKMTAETAGQLKTAEYYQVPRVHNLDPDEYTTIVDAIFGVGLSRPVEGKYAELISTMNRASAYKVAVDIPSGIDSDTGFEKGIAFRADLTVTFAFRKRGLCFYPGRMYGGEIVVTDIGIYSIPGKKICMHHLVMQVKFQRTCFLITVCINRRKRSNCFFTMIHLMRYISEIYHLTAAFLFHRKSRTSVIPCAVYRIFLLRALHVQHTRFRNAHRSQWTGHFFMKMREILPVPDGLSVIQIFQLPVLHNTDYIADFFIIKMKCFCFLVK